MLPNVFLIGAMRSGTTTLNSMLGQHPGIYIPETKEPMFYLAEYYRSQLGIGDLSHQVHCRTRYDDFVARGKYRTPEAYRSLYLGASGEKYVLDSSHYLNFPAVAHTIKHVCPDAKFIVSLRNPAERLHSEYQLYKRTGKVQNSFFDWLSESCETSPDGEILEIGPDSRIRKGFYAELLKPWLDTFGENNVRVVFYEDLKLDSIAVVQAMYQWLGLCEHSPRELKLQPGGEPINRQLMDYPDRLTLLKSFLKKVLPRQSRLLIRSRFQRKLIRKEELPGATFTQLANIYKPDIERLQTLTSRDLSHWLEHH